MLKFKYELFLTLSYCFFITSESFCFISNETELNSQMKCCCLVTASKRYCAGTLTHSVPYTDKYAKNKHTMCKKKSSKVIESI